MYKKGIYIRKAFSFESAHHLPNHKGKCKNLHGHSYKLEVTIGGKLNGMQGMIVDFTFLKETVVATIIERLDHTNLNNTFPNPTAELMASWIFDAIEQVIGFGKDRFVQKIRLWETKDSYAEVVREED